MTNKRVSAVVISLIISFLILKFIGYYKKEDKGFIGFFGRLLNKTNAFEFTFYNVDKNDVDIIWNSEDNSDTLVKRGVVINNFGYDYGQNRFTVFYKNKMACSGSFFSQNNNESYAVKISVIKKSQVTAVVFLFDGKKEVFVIE
jgi:hypothetical protein